MKKRIRTLSAALILGLGAAVAGPVSPAFAINGVRCNEDGYLKIHYVLSAGSTNIEGDNCYANAGGTELYLGTVKTLWSGNNAGYITYYTNGGQDIHRLNFEKFKSYDVGGTGDYLQIW